MKTLRFPNFDQKFKNLKFGLQINFFGIKDVLLECLQQKVAAIN